MPATEHERLQALIFDVDGTLADTERDGHRVAFNRAFAAAGLPCRWGVATYGRLLAVGGGRERIRHFTRLDSRLPRLSDADIDSLHQAKQRYYADLVAAGTLPLRPGVLRLLREARSAGLRLAIATTSSRAGVEALLHRCVDPSALNWFDVIATGNDTPTKKPAPDVYELVLRRLGLSARDCLAIEDSEHGLRAALAAGLPTVVTVSDYTRDQDFTGALAVLEHLGDPGNPARVLRGPAVGPICLDLTLLQAWWRQNGPAPD